MTVSFIIPTLNEETVIQKTLDCLQAERANGHEIVLVDGGSQDQTIPLAREYVDHIIQSAAGRSVQMNRGATASQGDILCFLHADTLAPIDCAAVIEEAVTKTGRPWGRFDVRLSGSHSPLRVIETMINFRSRLSGIATGDQGIFVMRTFFEQIGGFPLMPLMEDIQFSKQAKAHSRPVCLSQRLVTSSRRWEQNGIFKTVWLMWRLRLAFYLGADPHQLAQRYRNTR